jgi:hypothetical protein
MPATVDLMFLTLLGRHATAAEQEDYGGMWTINAVDKFFSTAESDNTQIIMRLYKMFGRAPDVGDPERDFSSGQTSGFAANLHALEDGTTTCQLVDAFVHSAEGVAKWGNLAKNDDVRSGNVGAAIRKLYIDVLGREAGSLETSAWRDANVKFSDIVYGIVESNEAKALDVSDAYIQWDVPGGPVGIPFPPMQPYVDAGDIWGYLEINRNVGSQGVGVVGIQNYTLMSDLPFRDE